MAGEILDKEDLRGSGSAVAIKRDTAPFGGSEKGRILWGEGYARVGPYSPFISDFGTNGLFKGSVDSA